MFVWLNRNCIWKQSLRAIWFEYIQYMHHTQTHWGTSSDRIQNEPHQMLDIRLICAKFNFRLASCCCFAIFFVVYDWIKFRKMPMDNLKSNMPRQLNGKSYWITWIFRTCRFPMNLSAVLLSMEKKLQFWYIYNVRCCGKIAAY